MVPIDIESTIGSGNSLMLSGNDLLAESTSTEFSDAI